MSTGERPEMRRRGPEDIRRAHSATQLGRNEPTASQASLPTHHTAHTRLQLRPRKRGYGRSTKYRECYAEGYAERRKQAKRSGN